MKQSILPFLSIFTIAVGVGVARGQAQDNPMLRYASAAINARNLLNDIRVLASDEFEGRGPGTPGEEKTIVYLTDFFRGVGLKPGNPNGSFVQEVPMVGITSKAEGSLKFGEKSVSLRFPNDWVAVSRRLASEVSVKDSEVVFVGYGVVAPEYGWDDYKGLDVKGKTLVMLVNDPPVPDPKDPSKLDDATFKGRAMTYYGRWTYKYEIASEKGAVAVLLVHETGPAGYPYQVVIGSWGRENFDIPSPSKNEDRVAVEAWLSLDKAKELIALGGQDLDALKKAAVRKDFEPVPLNAKADFQARNKVREIRSKNVVAKFPGSDPKLKDEYVVYTAHWDHLGRDETLKGDQIFNGAADNASGVASVMEIARGYSLMGTPPRRSILFLVVTGEEYGLLGAKYYAAHPLYPLAKTAADLNIDVINTWGRTKDFVSVAQGNSTLDDVLAKAAAAQGRVIRPDPEPEKGGFYRSDHFEFAKQGVPALYYSKGGIDYIGKPAGYGLDKRQQYTQLDYHKVSDEVKSDWDLTGAVDDLRLLLTVGYEVAQSDKIPEWKPGAEFRAKREETLKPSRR